MSGGKVEEQRYGLLYSWPMVSAVVSGQEYAAGIAADLVKDGVWFVVDPLSGEQYRITVRDECREVLADVVTVDGTFFDQGGN